MNPGGNQDNNNNPSKRTLKGLKGAMDKMIEAFKAQREKREERFRTLYPLSQMTRIIESNKQKETRMRNQASNSNPPYRVFQNERSDVNVSDRVAEASKSHLKKIEEMEKLSSHDQSRQINPPKSSPTNNIQAPQQKAPEQLKPQAAEVKPVKGNVFGQPKAPVTNNIFDNKPQTPNLLFGSSKPQSNNIFAQKPATTATTPITSIFQSSISETKNIPAEKPLEVVEKKVQQAPKINIFAEGLFEENSKKPKPVLIFNNSQKPQPESEKKEKLTPSQPAVKLLFNNNGAVVEKIKPQVNIFNGGEPIQETKEEQKNPPMEMQNVPAPEKKVNLFEVPKMEVQTPSQSSLFSNNQKKEEVKEIPKPNLFNNNQQPTNLFSNNQKKEEAKEVQKQNLFNNGQKATNLFGNNQKKEEEVKELPKQNLFNNSQPTNLFGNNQTDQNIFSNHPKPQGLFANTASQPVSSTTQVENPFLKSVPPKQNQTTIPQVSLFEKNTTPNLFSNPPQNSQNKGGLFGRKEQPKPEEKLQSKQTVQNNNIFGAPTTSNIFGKKPQTQQKPPQPTGGLFSTPNTNNNIFNQPKQQANLFNIKAPVNENQLKEIKQQASNSEKSLFAQSLKNSNMFAKSQSKEQSKISASQPAPQNIFGKSSQNNIFLNPSPNIFSQQNESGSLFGNKPNDQKRGAALFSQEEIKEKQDDEDGEGEHEDENGLVKSNMTEGNESEVVYENYQKTDIFAKVEAVKFKIVKENKLLDHVKLSLQKLQGDDKIYIIVRNPNKTSKCLGVLLPNSELKTIPKNDTSDISFSINNLIQIDLPEQKKQTFQSWRIMIKKSQQGTKFIDKVKQIIEDLKKKQQKRN